MTQGECTEVYLIVRYFGLAIYLKVDMHKKGVGACGCDFENITPNSVYSLMFVVVGIDTSINQKGEL